MTPEELAEIEAADLHSLQPDAQYNADVWTLDSWRRALLAEVKRLQSDAKRWHDTYQQFASGTDTFLSDLLELLPGTEDSGSDAYDQIPRGIKALLAERDELKARIDSADQAFIDMAQTRGGLHRADELTHVTRIMSALRGRDTPHRVAYERVRAEARAETDRVISERDAAHAYARRLLAERDTVARAVRSPHLTDAEKLAEIREAFAVVEGQREEANR